VHQVHAFTYANAGARTGATGLTSADIGKVALQQDTNSFWGLIGVGPVTWTELTSSTVISTAAWLDANGNELLRAAAAASAVNQIDVANAATGNAPKISATGDDSNVSLLLDAKGTGVIRAQQALIVDPVALTDAATIATDASLGNHFRVTLGGNRTLGNPTNPTDGQRALWELIQDGTGTRTLAYDTKFAFGTDISSVTLTTTASKRDFLTAVYNSTADKWYVVGFVKGY